MSTWILADTHLDHTGAKPMDIFGPVWDNHAEVFSENWRRLIDPDDTVIIAGDISWSSGSYDVVPDLRLLDQLPGKRKILVKGNHDFWWSTRSKTERLFRDNGLTTLEILFNDAKYIQNEEQDIILVGTRGWKLPSDNDADGQDKKVFAREVNRFNLSLQAADKLLEEGNISANAELIAAFHYPPLNKWGVGSEMSEIIESTPIKRVFYGHVHKQHGNDNILCFEGENNGITYKNIALDYTNMMPIKITD